MNEELKNGFVDLVMQEEDKEAEQDMRMRIHSHKFITATDSLVNTKVPSHRNTVGHILPQNNNDFQLQSMVSMS